MAEIEYGGVKLGGSKLLLIVPLIGTIVGGLWGGFEAYQRYLSMEARINEFVTPDLSDYDKRIAVMEGKFAVIDKEMVLLKDTSEGQYITVRDLKTSLREDINRQEKIIDKVEDDISSVESDVRDSIDTAEGRFESKRDQLQKDYVQKSDTIREDVERKLTDLETRLNKKLQRALDNPLAN